MEQNKNKTQKIIIEKYSAIANRDLHTGCCASSGCCGSSVTVDITEAALRNGYSKEDLLSAPAEANMGLGCGNPLAIAAIREGEIVLDLGSGGGFDCFLAEKMAGKDGYVIGVDMTPEMVLLARENAEKMGYTNVEFRLGEIEHLPVADGSVDVIISNCVINLSQSKDQVFAEAYRVLKPGGRLSISDIVATAELPEEIKKDPDLLTGCIAGAEQADTIRDLLQRVGFKNIRLTPKDNSKEILKSWLPGSNSEDYVASFLIEAVKE